MSIGLIALLDDVAAIAKAAAASVDDVAGMALKAGTKSAGLVIDDAAVTPRYVVGLSPARELPIIVKITRGSLRNKLFYLLPAALILSLIAPWLITPLLMLGGCYLAYEGAEKVYHLLFPHQAHAHEKEIGQAPEDPKVAEDKIVVSAIRTDFILSAEIMAMTLSTVPDAGFVSQALVLAIVGVGITLLVYGAVALIVKADDIGLALAKNPSTSALARLGQSFGRGLVLGMPYFLQTLAIVGTAAMIWVGGGILIHGLAGYAFAGIEHAIHHASEVVRHAAPVLPGLFGFLTGALGAGIVGLAVGFVLIPLVGRVIAPAADWLEARFAARNA